MYENPALQGWGTHDELHKQRVAAGEIAPVIVGGVNLDEATAVAGSSLGYVTSPGAGWERVSWGEYIAKSGGRVSDCGVPPCFRWFPAGSWPISIQPPPEGSLDEESLDALVQILAAASPHGLDTQCFAFYAALPASDFDTPHLWRGPLGAVPELIEQRGGTYGSSPSNFWSVDREWFVWSDWDLQGTKVSGAEGLIGSLQNTSSLETLSWQRPVAGTPTTSGPGRV
ncbi:hypothetical protein GCM10028820_33720 [Tessaracoccus terricola]